MNMISVKVKITGKDNYNNPINTVKLIHRDVEHKPWMIVGANILRDINTQQIETIVEITKKYQKNFNCNNCQDWGCSKCCSSTAEVRSRQGMFQ